MRPDELIPYLTPLNYCQTRQAELLVFVKLLKVKTAHFQANVSQPEGLGERFDRGDSLRHLPGDQQPGLSPLQICLPQVPGPQPQSPHSPQS